METTKAKPATEVRPLYTIATEIVRTWKPKIYFGAVPYVTAMLRLNRINEMYGADTARSVVLYFLANAQTWRGEDAKRIKLELNQMLKAK